MISEVLFVISNFAVLVKEMSQMIVTLTLETNQLLRI